MKVEQALRDENKGWVFQTEHSPLNNPLVLVFGNRKTLEQTPVHKEVRALYPNGHIIIGSGCGEILNSQLHENTVLLSALEFEKSNFQVRSGNLDDYDSLEQLSSGILKDLPLDALRHIMVISDGSSVNGSRLVETIAGIVGTQIPISGGLCGDDTRFEYTLTSYNREPRKGDIIIVAFYGEQLEVKTANFGGWKVFGPERRVSRSQDNILYEIDGKPALELYKKYLGEKAKDLPHSALFYPLQVWDEDASKTVVRTILNIDTENQSMILAGDIPNGSKVQLMMATSDDIVEGASRAAEMAIAEMQQQPEFAMLVSCVGRKLVLDQRTEDELEEVSDIIGKEVRNTGIYSYGELSPFHDSTQCGLHNQTMTLTLFSEACTTS
jgi:hypothetical protein